MIPEHNLLSKLSLRDQIVEIENSHHSFTREELDRIFEILNALNEIGAIVPKNLQLCIEELRDDLLPHLLKEEQILFPYISALEADPANPPHSCFGSIANPIRMMQVEHEHVKSLLIKLRGLSSNYMVTNEALLEGLFIELEKLDRDLQEHIRWEDRVIFPQALKLENYLSY